MDKLLQRRMRKLVFLGVVSCALGWVQMGWADPQSATDAVDMKKKEVLDLQTAAAIALADNPSLAAAQARVGQAREAVRQARSRYWPKLDLTASQSRVDLSDNAFESQQAAAKFLGSSQVPSNPDDFYRAGLAASWLLFDGFSRWFTLAAAKHGLESSDAAREDAQRLLLQSVSSAFVSAQLSLENVSIAKADEAFNQRQLTEAKLRHSVGTGALSDVLNFEVKANSAKSDLIVAERDYETARIGLAALLGIENARLPENMKLAALEEASEEELKAPELDQLLTEAYDGRPDLQQNESAIRQAQAQVKAKRGEYYPTLFLVGSYDAESNEGFGFDSDEYGNSIGINLSYNIFSGGLTRAEHQQAKIRLRETEEQRDNVKVNITSEVQNTTQRLLSAQKQLLLQRTNAQLVQKNRNLVEKEYKAGVGSLVRLNEAQRDLTAAKVQLAAAQVALRQAWYDLWSASGQIKKNLSAND